MVPSSTVDFEINGERFDPEQDEPITVRSLLEKLDLTRRHVAVAINAQVVPRSRFDEVRVQAGDRVELIQAVGGG